MSENSPVAAKARELAKDDGLDPDETLAVTLSIGGVSRTHDMAAWKLYVARARAVLGGKGLH
jgi:hypothetical protein